MGIVRFQVSQSHVARAGRTVSEPVRAARTAFASNLAARAVAILAAAGIAACEASPPVEPADLVLTNGRIVTVDDAVPGAEAVAVRGGLIVAVGSSEEMAAHVGAATEVIDLQGRLAVPGFIEGHGHFMGFGRAKTILDLTTVKNWEEVVTMVRDAVALARPGEWIFGRGWHQEKWDAVPPGAVDGVPLHHTLSAVSPDNPVLLTHASGHAAFANARAMSLANITAGTANPSGGEVVHDALGNPTGLLRETAQRLVSAVSAPSDQRSPEEVYAEQKRYVELAGQEALSKGVTSFQDAGSDFATIDFLRSLEQRGELPIRLYVMVRRESNEDMDARLPQYFMPIEGNDFLTVRSIKRQIDGALGPHGAWLLQPYLDLPASAGLNLEDPADIEETARIAIKHGFQVNTHAIGDRANREVLDIYERVFRENPDRTDVRWRIEHAQHIDPADVPRFGQLGVIAAMQGIHCTSDAPWVLKRLGPERAGSGAYVWRDLMNTGAIIANGTDVPVEDINPIASFYASVSRRTADGTVFHAEQVMTREEALRSYTLNNAIAAFEEQLKGSITVGKLGDITVLDRDIMTIPEAEIPGTRVDLTIVGGEIRYRRDQEGS
ncbi:MAG: amidohydrolase [Gemmatimonadetes bacterium]|nr:amidohydrolase [Gemmatimonadota bacterium]